MFENLLDSIGLIAQTDKEVADAMQLELDRQKRNIELIASENIVSPAVMAAMPRAILQSATTAAANVSISLKILP